MYAFLNCAFEGYILCECAVALCAWLNGGGVSADDDLRPRDKVSPPR